MKGFILMTKTNLVSYMKGFLAKTLPLGESQLYIEIVQLLWYIKFTL